MITTLSPILVFLSRIALFTVVPSPLGVGEGTTVKRAILDKNTRIGDNVVIINKDRVEEADKPELGFYIRNGIVVVVKNATIANGTVI